MNDISQEIKPSCALVLDGRDNVGTMLAAAGAGVTVTFKGRNGSVHALDDIPYGHKIAVNTIQSGSEITKYGQCIGRATTEITAGSWVHLHNMESVYDTGFRERIS